MIGIALGGYIIIHPVTQNAIWAGSGIIVICSYYLVIDIRVLYAARWEKRNVYKGPNR